MCLPLKKDRFVRATALRSIISIIMDLCDSQKKIPAAMATVGEVATIEPQLPQLDVVHGPKECKECKELQTAEAELIRWIPEVCCILCKWWVHYQYTTNFYPWDFQFCSLNSLVLDSWYIYIRIDTYAVSGFTSTINPRSTNWPNYVAIRKFTFYLQIDCELVDGRHCSVVKESQRK